MTSLEDTSYRNSFGRKWDYRDDRGCRDRSGGSICCSEDERRRRIGADKPQFHGRGTGASRFLVEGFGVSRRPISRPREQSRNGHRWGGDGEEGWQGRDCDCPCRGRCGGNSRGRRSRNRNRRRVVDNGYLGSLCTSASYSAALRTGEDRSPLPNAFWIGGYHSLRCSSSGRRRTNKPESSSYSLRSTTGRRRARRKRWIGAATVASFLLAMTAMATAAATDVLPRVVSTGAKTVASFPRCAGRTSRRTHCCFVPSGTDPPFHHHRMRRLCRPSVSRYHRPSSPPTRLNSHASAPNGEGGRGHDTTEGAVATVLAAKREQLRSATRLSLAPMMDYTDRHFRYLMRLITSRTLLYSEMIAANALAHERRARVDFEEELLKLRADDRGEQRCYDDFYLRRFLAQSSLAPGEGPSVLQLGGSDPRQMYESARAVLEASSSLSSENYYNGDGGYSAEYTALNLNCGCPSPKVAGKGCFGAALMHDPDLVRDLCSSMSDGTDGTHPVTVKCRIGTDSTPDDDDQLYSGLCRFVDTVASGGVVTDFQVHARIAILKKKISPAKNRSVPPLKYHLVRRLAMEFPELTITLNGGVDNLIRAGEELNVGVGDGGGGGPGTIAGVMVGRGMAAAPWNWATADEYLFGGDGASPNNDDDHLPRDRWELLRAYGAHADSEEATYGTKVRRFILRALQGVFAGEHNAKRFRVALDEIGGLPKKEEEQARRRQLQQQQLGEYGGGDVSSAGPTGTTTTPLSELILRAARDCFSDEVLHRTRTESFEMMRLGVEKEEGRIRRRTSAAAAAAASVSMGGGRGGDDVVHDDGGEGSRSAVVREWQTRRREEEVDAMDAADGDREDAAGEGSGFGEETERWVQSS